MSCVVDPLDGSVVWDGDPWELLGKLSLDDVHELEVLLVPLIGHCHAVSLFRGILMPYHGAVFI